MAKKHVKEFQDVCRNQFRGGKINAVDGSWVGQDSFKKSAGGTETGLQEALAGRRLAGGVPASQKKGKKAA